ncbi:DUF1835 domain-containing protein [Neobacillus muris]|uniref:DUF1835 domain-containing protein n=1 Tax=Neobacillus muris TaxID=2941334 RepID=UPI0020407D75|nr:DUF1835 domain-containing protein [Neobacillus muris]
MRTKALYPYIYFFMEPNIVFVYQIESSRYLTLSELHHRGEWQTYELSDSEEFETFHHAESEPLIGRGYAVRQDDRMKMLEHINQQIQQHRQFPMDGPVHMVVSESAAGCLRFGLERPKTVIGFPDFFAIGPVWQLHETAGQDFRFEWLYEHINTEMEDYERETLFKNTLMEIEDIPEQLPIYLWTANNASEQTGIRFMFKLLSGKANKVFLMNSTSLYESFMKGQDGFQLMTHTSQIEPEKLRLFLEMAALTPLSEEERLRYEKEWQELSRSSPQQVLRIWKQERIVNVPETYYDELILSMLEKLQQNQEFILTARIIGETLSQMDEIISDSFLEYRIRTMVYNGALQLKGIPKSMRHYSVKLR